MTIGYAVTDRRGVRGLVARHHGPPATDRDLLGRFAADRDEGAFAALVGRHAGMVLAAGRRVLGNPHDAEDVCQAAFLLLARKARSRGWQPSLANWLHRTAHLLALKVRTAAARRARREGRAAARAPTQPLAEMTGQELLAALDAELLALPEPLRGPLVLCYLEGLTRDEAARRLGLGVPTLKKRLERGRDRLRDRLARRGLGLPAVLAGALLIDAAAPAATFTLARDTARLATGGVVPPRVAALVHGGIGMTGWNKVWYALGVLAAGGLVAAGAVALGRPADPPAAPPPAAAKAAAKPALRPEPAAGKTLRVVVRDKDGHPVPGATVHRSVWTDEKDFKANRDIETDSDGATVIDLPKTYTILRLWVSKPGYAGLFFNWEQAELTAGKLPPAEYAVRLEPAVTAGGRVVDEAGKPVAGARVEVEVLKEVKPAGTDGRVRYNGHLTDRKNPGVTDADGRWQVGNVPDHPEAELGLLVTHPDYRSDEFWRQPGKEAGWDTAKLRAGAAVAVLKPGVVVTGRVTDPDGKPVKDAIVVRGDDPYDGHTTSTFATDADGRFKLPALAPGKTNLTVITGRFAPQMRAVEVKPGLPPQDFALAAGKPARLRFVDPAGKPIPGAKVFLHQWKGSKSIYSDRNPNHQKVPGTGIPAKADAAGVWHWQAAPDEPVKVETYANGFAALELDVTGGMAEKVVTLKPEHRITGKVTDAVTGKPIPAFTVIPIDVFGKDHLHAERFNGVAGKDGRLDYLATRTDIPLRVRIEAPGYRTQDGPEFRVGDDGNRVQDFKLQPSPPRTGVVVGPDGRPAAGVLAQVATPTDPIHRSGTEHRLTTDAAGQFRFPDPGEPWTLVAQSEAGVAVAECPADRADAGTLTLRPWAAVRGRFTDGGKPVAGARVFATPVQIDDLSRPRVDFGLQTRTDADGRFAFPRVPPGPVCVRVLLGPWEDPGYRSAPSVPLDLKPGEQADLALGAGGATLAGKVKLTGKVPADLDCTYSLNHLVRREPGIAPPPEVAAAGFDIRKGWDERWHQTPEGRAFQQTLRSWFVKLGADGSFRVSGVPPGEYDLAVAVYAKPEGCLVDPLARKVVRVTVSAADATKGEVTVPQVPAAVIPVPAVGDVPALSFEQPDGQTGTLAAARGKGYTVVHFWASWCGPCKKQLPALKGQLERYADKGVGIVGLALDEDAGAWRTAVKRLDLPGPQGRLTNAEAAGVSSVPAYWLLDPAGKIVEKVYEPAALAEAIDRQLKVVR